MTKEEVLKMTLEALEGIQRYGLDTLSGRIDGPDDREWQRAGVNEMTKQARLAITAIKEHKDVYAEQEPLAWISTGPARMIHWTSDKPAYGDDWVPLYTTPPQRTERPVDCERCNRLEEQAYDLVGKLRVANIKLSMLLPRTWVELTDDEIWEAYMKAPLTLDCSTDELYALARTVEAKLKQKNI